MKIKIKNSDVIVEVTERFSAEYIGALQPCYIFIFPKEELIMNESRPSRGYSQLSSSLEEDIKRAAENSKKPRPRSNKPISFDKEEPRSLTELIRRAAESQRGFRR